jgi:DNA adenine methylase
VLIYADPPYLGSTRTGGRYKHEMLTAAQHEELAESLHQARAGVVLSGYPSPLYERLYAGWDLVEIPTTTGRSGTPLDRAEVLWSNRPIAEPRLFTDDQLTG